MKRTLVGDYQKKLQVIYADEKYFPWRLSVMESWYFVSLSKSDRSNASEVYESLVWISENCQGRYSFRNLPATSSDLPKTKVYFELAEDAMAYKLLWYDGR